MAKLLADLPDGLVKGTQSLSKPSPASVKGDGRVQANKALQRPPGVTRMNDHSDWMIRRCDAFGIASSRYFKKNQSCPRPKKD